MLESVPQYRIQCDGCAKRSGVHHDPQELVRRELAAGWQSKEVEHPVLPEVELPVTLFRCPLCVKARRFPKRWNCVPT